MGQHSSTYINNGVGHFDVAGPDISSLASFYSAVLGWNVDSLGPGYAQIGTPEGTIKGAMVESETAGITIGIVVADLEATVTAAQERGGTTVMPVVDNGWVRKAQVRDPAGNLLTLIQG